MPPGVENGREISGAGAELRSLAGTLPTATSSFISFFLNHLQLPLNCLSTNNSASKLLQQPNSNKFLTHQQLISGSVIIPSPLQPVIRAKGQCFIPRYIGTFPLAYRYQYAVFVSAFLHSCEAIHSSRLHVLIFLNVVIRHNSTPEIFQLGRLSIWRFGYLQED